MNDQLKNLLIGLFVICAISLFVSFILFLKPSVGDMKKTLYVRFSNIDRIDIGTRVLFAGKPVGEVVAITEVFDARQQASDSYGRVYFYQLTLKVDSSVQVYNTDEIAIETSGLLGEKSIAIIPKAPAKGIIPQPITDAPIYADSDDPFENALMEFSDLAKGLHKTIDEVNFWIESHGEEVAGAIGSFGSAMDQIDQMVGSVNSSHLIEEAERGAAHFGDLMADLQEGVEDLKKMDTFTNVGEMICHLRNSSESIEFLTGDLADAKGTLGKLISQDDLYQQISHLFCGADQLINNINHYGLLFHLNKGWQRAQLQSCPTECSPSSLNSDLSAFLHKLQEFQTHLPLLQPVQGDLR